MRCTCCGRRSRRFFDVIEVVEDELDEINVIQDEIVVVEFIEIIFMMQMCKMNYQMQGENTILHGCVPRCCGGRPRPSR